MNVIRDGKAHFDFLAKGRQRGLQILWRTTGTEQTHRNCVTKHPPLDRFQLSGKFFPVRSVTEHVCFVYLHECCALNNRNNVYNGNKIIWGEGKYPFRWEDFEACDINAERDGNQKWDPPLEMRPVGLPNTNCWERPSLKRMNERKKNTQKHMVIWSRFWVLRAAIPSFHCFTGDFPQGRSGVRES